MLPIQKNLTSRNRTVMNNKLNKYIVIHWVGAVSTAKDNTVYFKSAYRGASANYFVDDTSIWQCVEDKDRAWHCGAWKYYCDCRNDNSIGIEMCCKKDSQGNLYVTDATIQNTGELVRHLMAEHNIPESRVIRHYDVTHKKCPAPYIEQAKWEALRDKLCHAPVVPSRGTVVKEDFEVKTWRNGCTKEVVYMDSACKNSIGYIDPWSVCPCHAIIDGKYMVSYEVNGTNYHKVGFVKYAGGIK